MTLAEAQRALKDATEKANAASDARKAAESTLRDACQAEDEAYRAMNRAARDLSVLRGRAWIAKHPDDVETVRAGTDRVRLAQLKLGRTRTDRGWRTSYRFEWNQTGDDVRAAIAADAAKEPS